MIPPIERNSILIHALYDYRKKCQVRAKHFKELGDADLHEYYVQQALWVLEMVDFFELKTEVIIDYSSKGRSDYEIDEMKSLSEKVKSGFPKEPVTLPALSF